MNVNFRDHYVITSAPRRPFGQFTLSLRPLVHNMMLNNALHCAVFASTLVETQHNARIDSNPILAFPCVALVSGRQETPDLFSNKFVRFAN